jgi:formate dehydrogenase subunit delta
MSQMTTEGRLTYMANQIAANFAIAGCEAAATATADHINSFWDPRMRSRILAQLDKQTDGDISLCLIARRAVEILSSRQAPAPQTPATVFAGANQAGRSDAG